MTEVKSEVKSEMYIKKKNKEKKEQGSSGEKGESRRGIKGGSVRQ